MSEFEKMREIIATNVCSNFVQLEKFRLKELMELWRAVQVFGASLERSQALRGQKELHKEWMRVQAALMRLG